MIQDYTLAKCQGQPYNYDGYGLRVFPVEVRDEEGKSVGPAMVGGLARDRARLELCRELGTHN